jgi:hypothetical protein
MFNSLATFQKFPAQSLSVPHKPRWRPPGDVNLCSLGEGLVAELQYAALVTAVVTSAVNTLFGPEAPVSSASVEPYASLDLSLLRSLKTMSVEMLGGSDDLFSLRVFLGELDESQQAYRCFDDDIPVISEDRAIILHRRGLTGSWQRSCRAAVSALRELETVMSGKLSEPYLQNHRVLNGLLKSSAQGFKPCLDERGQVFMPPLPQKRRWPRFSVLQTCMVTLNGEQNPAFIRDASAGGLGLDRMPNVALGTFLIIETESGRLLTGSVVWSQNGSAGLKFFKPLLASDPLMGG